MSPVVIVPIELVCHVMGKLGSRRKPLQIISLLFQGTPKPFDEDVVLKVSLAVYTHLDVPSLYGEVNDLS